MDIQLKPLEEQVVVITGASSGIGLVTAKMAAERGARVLLASRNRGDLRRAVKEIEKEGGEASYETADVTDPKEVEGIAKAARKRFGGFDTWVNNAGVSIYGTIDQVPLEDARQLFETNYWGVVHGSLAALPTLRRYGGALINLGSILSDRAIPLQGHYSASKHAVKGFTDALRMELEKEDAPVSVTLIKPGAIDTPYPHHAKNFMAVEPKHPAPVYAPRAVARAILRCAERPTRDITVGAGGRMISAMGNLAPRFTDRYMEATMFDQQKSDDKPSRKNILHKPYRKEGAERGDYPGYVMKSSAYTQSKLHPVRTALTLAALGLGAAVVFGGEGNERSQGQSRSEA